MLVLLNKFLPEYLFSVLLTGCTAQQQQGARHPAQLQQGAKYTSQQGDQGQL